MLLLSGIESIGSLYQSADDFRKGATAPTDVTLGTTPTVAALNFSAINELISASLMMPEDWDKSKDVELTLLWSLSQTEVDSETLDGTVDYISVQENTTGGGHTKANSSETAAVTVTTANGLAIGDLYTMTFTLLAADGTNGWAVDDDTIGIWLEFHLTNITGVAEANLVSGRLNYGRKLKSEI